MFRMWSLFLIIGLFKIYPLFLEMGTNSGNEEAYEPHKFNVPRNLELMRLIRSDYGFLSATPWKLMSLISFLFQIISLFSSNFRPFEV
jgi:hypothetical protein